MELSCEVSGKDPYQAGFLGAVVLLSGCAQGQGPRERSGCRFQGWVMLLLPLTKRFLQSCSYLTRTCSEN